MMPNPQTLASRRTNAHITRASWLVQYYAFRNISASPGVRIGGPPLEAGTADYLVYPGGKAEDPRTV